MICDKCGSQVAEDKKDPWCMYKFQDGKVISQLFHPDHIPVDWFDSPKAAKNGSKKESPVKPNVLAGKKHDNRTRINR